MFPEHEEFQSLDITDPRDVPEFWRCLRLGFETATDRFLLEVGSDYTFGATVVRLIYLSNNNTEINADDDVSIRDWVSKVDLEYILKNLMRNATLGHNRDGLLQHRAIVSTTYLAAGRGGESKFVDTFNWMYHLMIETTDTVWTEMKTMNKYTMPMFPNKPTESGSYLCDFYHCIHCIGSFWAVEAGLHRTDEHNGIESFLFPHLHKLRNEYVTRKITKIIRSVLPTLCPKQLKDELSAKSLRKGSVSTLMLHKDMNGLGDIVARTGHSTKSNLDSYADKRNVVRGLRGGRALANWDNAGEAVQVPSFACITKDADDATKEAVNAFIDRLFVVSLPRFKPEGTLYIVLKTCAASLVMWSCITAWLQLN